MALSIMANGGGYVTAKQDGAMLNTFTGGRAFVIGGIGNQLSCTATSGTLLVTLNTGQGVICGRSVFQVNDSETPTQIQLKPNDSGYVVIRMDLTKPAGSETYLCATPTVYTENLNANGRIHDLPLYKYSTGVSTVTSFTSVRSIKTER